jgi:hypothetical protein
MPPEPSHLGQVLDYQTPPRGMRSPYRGIWVLRIVLLCVAGGLFWAAYDFGSRPAFQQTQRSSQPGAQIASNVTAGLASLGFALAGGMALLAAALVRPDPAASA